MSGSSTVKTNPVFSREPINWTLIQQLHAKPHPLIRHDWVQKAIAVADEHGVPYLGEVAQEEQASHHLLDMLGVPAEHHGGYANDLDARVWRAVVGAFALQERLSRIATWHSRETAPGGMVGDYCNECGRVWPCDTYRMANGDWTDKDDDDLADVLTDGDVS